MTRSSLISVLVLIGVSCGHFIEATNSVPKVTRWQNYHSCIFQNEKLELPTDYNRFGGAPGCLIFPGEPLSFMEALGNMCKTIMDNIIINTVQPFIDFYRSYSGQHNMTFYYRRYSPNFRTYVSGAGLAIHLLGEIDKLTLQRGIQGPESSSFVAAAVFRSPLVSTFMDYVVQSSTSHRTVSVIYHAAVVVQFRSIAQAFRGYIVLDPFMGLCTPVIVRDGQASGTYNTNSEYFDLKLVKVGRREYIEVSKYDVLPNGERKLTVKYTLDVSNAYCGFRKQTDKPTLINNRKSIIKRRGGVIVSSLEFTFLNWQFNPTMILYRQGTRYTVNLDVNGHIWMLNSETHRCIRNLAADFGIYPTDLYATITSMATIASNAQFLNAMKETAQEISGSTSTLPSLNLTLNTGASSSSTSRGTRRLPQTETRSTDWKRNRNQ